MPFAATAQPLPLEATRGSGTNIQPQLLSPVPVVPSQQVVNSNPMPMISKPVAASFVSKEVIAIYGHGNSKCTEFITFVDAGQEAISKNYQIWLNGFISAYNTMTSQTGNVAGDKKIDELMRWMDAYCRENPENFFQRATIELLKALEDKKF